MMNYLLKQLYNRFQQQKLVSNTKHLIKNSGKYRRLTPLELERLNMFPDNHTEGASDSKRAFFMGNALVIGIVKRFLFLFFVEIVTFVSVSSL